MMGTNEWMGMHSNRLLEEYGDNITDEQLIELWNRGDERVIAYLYYQNTGLWKWLFNKFQGLLDSETIELLLLDSILNTLKNWKLNGGAKLTTYIKTSASNAMCREIDSRKAKIRKANYDFWKEGGQRWNQSFDDVIVKDNDMIERKIDIVDIDKDFETLELIDYIHNIEALDFVDKTICRTAILAPVLMTHGEIGGVVGLTQQAISKRVMKMQKVEEFCILNKKNKGEI